MNAFLAEIVRFLNGLLAVLIIIGAAAYGDTELRGDGSGFFIGLIVGLVAAVVVCGLLAVFIEIRSELVKIRIALTERPPLT